MTDEPSDEGPGDGSAAALVQQAVALRDAGRALDGAEVAGRAVALFHRSEQALPAARAQRLAADCLADADHHTDALGLLKRARRAFVAADPLGPDAAGAEAAAARSLRALGHVEESRRALHRAEAAFTEAGMPVRAAVCLLDRAVLLHDDGDVADAIELLAEAKATFLAHRRADLAAVGDFDLGVALLDGGRAEDAIERFLGARGIFASLGRRADEAACDLNMGVALHAVGRTDEARQALRRARNAFRDLGRDRDVEQAEHDLDVLDGLVDPDTAELSVLRTLGEVPPEVTGLTDQLAAVAPAPDAAVLSAEDEDEDEATPGPGADDEHAAPTPSPAEATIDIGGAAPPPPPG